MATLVERVQAVEERTDDIEAGIARYIEATNRGLERLDRLERIVERNEEEGARARAEAARERAQLRQAAEEAARERQEAREAAARASEEAARERQEAARERQEAREAAARASEEAARERQEAARERQEAREAADKAAERTDKAIDRIDNTVERMRQDGLANERAMNKRWGELANKWGTVVEDIVAPSVRRLALEVFDCGEMEFFSPRVTRVRSDDRARQREFDALYIGTKGVLLNETKSAPRSRDVQSFARFLRSGEFALYFPECRHLPVVPVFSALHIPDDMVTNLTRNGIYALVMGDYAMQVANLDAVRNRRAS